MDNKDYDAMFRQSQQNPFRKPEEQQAQTDFMLQQRQQREQRRETVTPEVLDATGRPVEKRSGGLSPVLCGVISLIIGAVSFILIFLGMFFHFLMWLNILFCLAGIGFGIAALLKDTAARVLGVIGIVACLFDLIVELICMIVVAVGSGISAIFRLLT